MTTRGLFVTGTDTCVGKTLVACALLRAFVCSGLRAVGMKPVASGCRADLSVVLVVGMRLGCLNQALLTAAAIHSRGLPFAGWVANCIDPNMLFLEENLQTLSRKLAAPLIATVPFAPDAARACAEMNLSLLAPTPSLRVRLAQARLAGGGFLAMAWGLCDNPPR